MKQLLFLALRLFGINALFRRVNRGRIKVLLYHHVMPTRAAFENAVTSKEFDAQLHHLRRKYNVIGLDQEGEWLGYDPARVNVLVTFDDGFIDNAANALALLVDHEIPAVFFLIAECAETGRGPPFTSKYRNATAEQLRTVGPNEIKAMLDAGMTIASHSLVHRDFRSLTNEEALDDALRSRKLLEEIGGRPVGNFAFPWGYFAPGQPELMTEVYKRVFLTTHGFCSPSDRLIPRNEVATLLHLEAAASGSLDFFREMLLRR